MSFSEFDLVRYFRRRTTLSGSRIICGIGDDCAVTPGRCGRFNLFTTDALVENVHFDRLHFSFYEIGCKAMASALSDIAAMGGRPLYALVSLGIPEYLAKKHVFDLYDGISSVAKHYRTGIVGGNISRSAVLWASLTIVGEVEKNNCKFRNGARVRDGIFVTGRIGSSAMGLCMLEKRKKNPAVFIKAHKKPRPRLPEGIFLGRQKGVSSMIDISDGLLADLGHVLEESNCGARVIFDRIPTAGGLSALAEKNGVSFSDLVLSGGEDYELLFTVNPKEEKNIFYKAQKKGYRLSKIGVIVEKNMGLEVLDSAGKKIRMRRKGFDHMACKNGF